MDPNSLQAATALLTEHLQYTPLSLIDDIIDSVNNLVYQGVGSLEAGLFATPPDRLGFQAAKQSSNPPSTSQAEYPEAKQEIEEGLHKLETLLNSTVDKNFDKFEIYVLRNILSVPESLASWVQLSHYEGMQQPPSAGGPTPDSIHLLRQQLNASRQVNRALQREYDRNQVMLAQLREMTDPTNTTSELPNLSFLSEKAATSGFSNQSQQPLATSTNFTLSQLSTLKTTLDELRKKLAMLHEKPLSTDTAKDELREERREYIEQRTKSVLERSGQSVGEETNVGGRKVDPSDLDALEKVATMLNSTGAPTG